MITQYKHFLGRLTPVLEKAKEEALATAQECANSHMPIVNDLETYYAKQARDIARTLAECEEIQETLLKENNHETMY